MIRVVVTGSCAGGDHQRDDTADERERGVTTNLFGGIISVAHRLSCRRHRAAHYGPAGIRAVERKHPG